MMGCGQPEPWSLREGLVSLPSQTCLALAPLPAGHLTPDGSGKWGLSLCGCSLGTEPVSTGLLDPLRSRGAPGHGDY